MLHWKILQQDWSEFDNKKILEGKDKDLFCCTKKWEVDFLVGKIKMAYPDFSEPMVRNAIAKCCKTNTFRENHLKSEFVFCVMKRLGV